MPAAEAEAAKAAEHTGLKWLLVEGQVDSGMWQGAALLGAVVAGVQLASEKQRETAINALLGGYRACGLTADKISDRQLIEDYVRKNAAAAVNVVMASPTFYFLFAKMHGQSLAVSSVRAFTGTRAAPRAARARAPPHQVQFLFPAWLLMPGRGSTSETEKTRAPYKARRRPPVAAASAGCTTTTRAAAARATRPACGAHRALVVRAQAKAAQ